MSPEVQELLKRSSQRQIERERQKKEAENTETDEDTSSDDNGEDTPPDDSDGGEDTPSDNDDTPSDGDAPPDDDEPLGEDASGEGDEPSGDEPPDDSSSGDDEVEFLRKQNEALQSVITKYTIAPEEGEKEVLDKSDRESKKVRVNEEGKYFEFFTEEELAKIQEGEVEVLNRGLSHYAQSIMEQSKEDFLKGMGQNLRAIVQAEITGMVTWESFMLRNPEFRQIEAVAKNVAQVVAAQWKNEGKKFTVHDVLQQVETELKPLFMKPPKKKEKDKVKGQHEPVKGNRVRPKQKENAEDKWSPQAKAVQRLINLKKRR